MTPRALILRAVDSLACKDNDKVVAQALGLIASGGLILLWIGLRLTPKKIGA